MKVICLFSARDFYGEGECLATFYSKQMITTTISTTSTLDTLLLASRETVVVQSWLLCARSRQQQQSAPHQLYTHQQLTRCCFYLARNKKSEIHFYHYRYIIAKEHDGGEKIPLDGNATNNRSGLNGLPPTRNTL
jgi:hypothetical protein